MANVLQLKRSAVAGRAPEVSDLAPGELAVNTHDGRLFLRKDNGTASIVEVTGANASGSIGFLVDGGGLPITTGLKGTLAIPFACAITSWTLMSDAIGSVVLDIWKSDFASYPPTVAQSITASAKPTISSDVKAHSSALTGWTTVLEAGDILAFNVDAVSGLSRLSVGLAITRL